MAQAQAIRGAIQTCRVTSSEMIVFGTLLRDALPREGCESMGFEVAEVYADGITINSC